MQKTLNLYQNPRLHKTSVSSSIFGNLDKYFEDLQNYEDELYCSNCGNDSKKTFNYIRTVANGEVYWCKRCKTENLVSEKPNEDNY
jgi:predicted SprT family Zn-dependent metalloprotease